MNGKLIVKLIGNMLCVEAVFMLLPLIVSLVYGENDTAAFMAAALITGAAGGLLSLRKSKEKKYSPKDAFAATALSWLILSLFGALPFYFSGCFDRFIDCAFESISGFTTTGATILTEVESLPKGILLWRNFTHWIGGMGVLVFILAVLPSMNASSVNLLKAESTGPSPNKIVPRIRETAKVMYLIYFAMTVLLFILLLLTGLPVYDSLANAFSIAGTGGFSHLNASFGAYNNVPAEIVSSVFMFLFGVSFTLYFYCTKLHFKQIIKDEEFRVFIGIIIVSILIITWNIAGQYGSVLQALRHASFQVSTIISTTGFSTADFTLWPTLSQTVLVILMFIGSCAGSTAGGMKVVRILLLFKLVRIELDKVIHPRSVQTVTLNSKKIEGEVLSKTTMFFFIYFVVFAAAVLLIAMENKDMITSVTAVMASLSNIGPGLGEVGPSGNFSTFSPFSKVVLSFCMMAGRLEFLPVLILFKPSLWFSSRIFERRTRR